MTDNGTALATVERGELRFTKEQEQLILRTCCGDASPDEARALLAIAQARGLNPITQECYFVQRWDTEKQRFVWAVQISIDGMRIKADDTGNYDGQDEPEFEYVPGGQQLVLARVRVYRKGIARPFVGVARWDEYVQTKKDGSPTRFWKQMPHNQLAKCAEALAMRKAFPSKFAKVYTAEEMAQAENEETSESRDPVERRSRPEPKTATVSGGPRVAGTFSEEPAPIPHDPETGEVKSSGDRPSPAQSARMMQRERELIECGTLQALAKVWQAIGADARSTAITLTQRAELSKVKDRCKQNLEDAQRAEEERANDVGNDPAGLLYGASGGPVEGRDR